LLVGEIINEQRLLRLQHKFGKCQNSFPIILYSLYRENGQAGAYPPAVSETEMTGFRSISVIVATTTAFCS
jgi:hypothetical protein